MPTKHIYLASDFTDAPGGRFRAQGKFSGEEFREDVLLPALRESDAVVVNLNGALGLPASFLDEAFGVIARKHGQLAKLLRIELNDNSVARKILDDVLPPARLVTEVC